MKKLIILLIEDDEFDIISVECLLKKIDSDYVFYIVYNGIEVLKMFRDVNLGLILDVIFLDINMFRMNGIEFLKIIREDKKLRNLKVFIMIIFFEGDDRFEVEKLGILGYIIKFLNYIDNLKRLDLMEVFV